MSVVDHFAAGFHSLIRRRGDDYFHRGRVLVESSGTSRIVAGVQGSRRYRVELQREGARIRWSCTCPYFATAACKHLWAVLRTIEEWPLLQGGGLKLERAPALDHAASTVDSAAGTGTRRVAARSGKTRSRSSSAGWRAALARVGAGPLQVTADAGWPPGRLLRYVIVRDSSGGGLGVEVLCQDRKSDGDWGRPRARSIQRRWLRQIPDAEDRQILAMLAGATPVSPHEAPGYSAFEEYGVLPARYRLAEPQAQLLLPLLCRTGRCHLRALPGVVPDGSDGLGPPLVWQEGECWRLHLTVRRTADGAHYQLDGQLRRAEERLAVRDPALLIEAGVLFRAATAAPFRPQSAAAWLTLLRGREALRVPVGQADEFLAALMRQPELPPLDLPAELRCEEVICTPRPRLLVQPERPGRVASSLIGELSFDYQGVIIAHGQQDQKLLQAAARRVLVRDPDAEQAAEQRLLELGWRWRQGGWSDAGPHLTLPARLLSEAALAMVREGWHVEAGGRLHRAADTFELQVGSGIDWFELHGSAQFGDMAVPLPELLVALQRGHPTVRLPDGSAGLLPQEWLQGFSELAGLGVAHGDHLRFRRSQAGLLDALLASQPQAGCDAVFARLRDELRNFTGIVSLPAPAGFRGELRAYQQESLGWFAFLRRFGFGGCLADDMGLGKTVQVLALLEARRADGAGPSLVVVPRSLVFNWQQEAARFAPQLRVLDHTGNTRRRGVAHFADFDLVLTTYGTLRNDVVELRKVRFDYLILDEAQAIKNAASVSAKAARLLQGEHRLALSGTPVENHLGELWSLFEFLNPAMLGTATAFSRAREAGKDPDEVTHQLLATALRPFILRRTKAQVARELPPRLEQTIYCDLDRNQRKLYDQLREHYRASLLRPAGRKNSGREKIRILEALLRLRQAAIHPGLLDADRRMESSAKLDVLLPRLRETVDEGHKTLVFSQFTGMLSILRQHLDRDGLPYEYLDGRTRDRQSRVTRFQEDPECRLFLISLKAGGTGLNLTAAQYVFLLDPWWNPAVEAQAIDRAHRIGQTRQVFACRLIARDTVEERVLELQQSKRDLADALVSADQGMLRQIGSAELELLLS